MTLLMSAAEALGRVPATFRGVAIESEPGMVGRPCGCGQLVWARQDSPAEGVAAHNASASHAAWWASVEADWQGEEL